MATQIHYLQPGDILTVKWPATIETGLPAPEGFTAVKVTSDYIEIAQDDPIREAVEAA